MTDKPRQKRNLNRERILDAAMQIGHREGVACITIRKLAQDLGVTPMAIYRHYKDKSELLSALLDAYILEADVAGHDKQDWQEWALETCWRMYQAIGTHSDFLPLLANTRILGKAAWDVVQQFLDTLQSAGLEEQEARKLFQALVNYLIGAATTRQIIVDDENADEEKELREGLAHILQAMSM